MAGLRGELAIDLPWYLAPLLQEEDGSCQRQYNALLKEAALLPGCLLPHVPFSLFTANVLT